MKRLKALYGYVEKFSKLQAIIAFCAGAGTTYYMSMLLLPVLGNAASYAVGATTGTAVGLITVYGAEHDIQNLVQEKKTQNLDLRMQCHESQLLYSKNKGKYEILDLQQISDRHIQKIFSILHTIISKLNQIGTITDTDLEQKLPYSRTETKTVITGGYNQRSEDEIEKIILDIDIEESALEQASDVSFLRKVWQFMRESKAAAKVTIITNLAMISYYIQYSLTSSAGVEDLIAWPISIVLGCLASPVITYLTAAPARNELAHLNQKHAFLQTTFHRLLAANMELQRYLGEIKKVTTSADDYKQLTATLRDAPLSTLNIGFLADSLKKFNEKRKNQFQAQPLLLTDSRAINYGLYDLKEPLLIDNLPNRSSSVNNSDGEESSSSWKCILL